MSGDSYKIGFVGTGQMATALAFGFIEKEIVLEENLFGYDISAESSARFQAATRGKLSDSLENLVDGVDILILAVKPQQMEPVLQDFRLAIDKVRKRLLLISIAAGLPIRFFENILGHDIRLARVMPNTPCLVGEAASGFSLSAGTLPHDGALVKRIFESTGIAYALPEHLLDAVTGLSGSGPAYAFMMIEALADGGVKMGLPRNIALNLAAQTLKGAAEMFLQTQEHPGLLKDRVASPAGTTIAGISVLEEKGFRSALISAVEAATKRSQSLGK